MEKVQQHQELPPRGSQCPHMSSSAAFIGNPQSPYNNQKHGLPKHTNLESNSHAHGAHCVTQNHCWL